MKSDTFVTATLISSLSPGIDPENQRKIACALGVFESNVDLSRLEKRIAVMHSARVTPLMFQHELIGRAEPSAGTSFFLKAPKNGSSGRLEIVLLRDVVDITLLGNPEEVEEKAAALGLSLGGVKIIDPTASELRPNSDRPIMNCASTRAFRGRWRGIPWPMSATSAP